jgi:transposase
MDKEHRMLEAKTLKAQGYKQYEIAEILKVTDRTVRNYLSKPATPRKIPKRKSLLDAFKPFIKSIIEDQPFYNCMILYDRLKAQGYQGKISILRDHVAQVRNEVLREAVIRFETEPGRQAQVDWKEYRRDTGNGRREKIYAFVMTFGYSRKSFVMHTKSMKQSFFEACHVKAFEYFGGVPKEILYDNMKTAFVCDAEGRFYPNKRLLALANHYGFVPKRCRIRRPQTKGKVERTIGYLVENYWPRVKDLDVSVEELNETVRAWLTSVDKNILRDFGESRNERFSKEKPYLNPLPAVRFEYRHREELLVNRESCITYRTNRYSVPPEYIGQMLTLQVDPLTNEADLQKEGFTIRNIVLESAGAKKRVMLPEDEQAINQLWMKQFLKRNRNGEGNSRSRTQDQPSVEIRNPADYDQYFHTAEEETVCTR